MMKQKLIYVMGVSGSGKTTIGNLIAKETNFLFFDGDDFHPKSNIDKMTSGVPLDDHDRVPWLNEINSFAINQLMDNGVVIACSALKENYRKILSKGIKEVCWVFLKGSFDLIHDRMKKRSDHFMPAALLKSQFDLLEIPENCIVIDIEKPIDLILYELRNKLPL